MKIVEIAQANATLAEYTSGFSEESVIITSNGQPIAALVNLWLRQKLAEQTAV